MKLIHLNCPETNETGNCLLLKCNGSVFCSLTISCNFIFLGQFWWVWFIMTGTVFMCYLSVLRFFRTYIFDEIRNKSGWFCWNNNFTMSKIHRDFFRIFFNNLRDQNKRPFRWPITRKWTVFLFARRPFHKSSLILMDRPVKWPSTLNLSRSK